GVGSTLSITGPTNFSTIGAASGGSATVNVFNGGLLVFFSSNHSVTINPTATFTINDSSANFGALTNNGKLHFTTTPTPPGTVSLSLASLTIGNGSLF